MIKSIYRQDDVLLINASVHFEKGKRQNTLREDVNGEPNYIQKIVETYQHRPGHMERYARRVSMKENENNGYNLNISRYVSTARVAVMALWTTAQNPLPRSSYGFIDDRTKPCPYRVAVAVL